MRTDNVKRWARMAQKPLMLAALIVLMAFLAPGVFLSRSNIASILMAVCIYGLMVCGTIFPLLNGGIDLSIGSVGALAGSICVLVTLRYNSSVGGTVLGIACGLAAGILCGIFNGFISYQFAVPAFIVTLASKNIIYGIAQNITGMNTILSLDSKVMNWIGTGKIAGVNFTILFFLFIVVATYFLLNHTKFGRYTYAVGGNAKSARFSGVKVNLIGISAYAISGFTAALTGIVLSCFNRQAVATQCSGYDGDVLVALVVGGVSLAGGEGTIQGAAFGILLMGILNNAMVLLGVNSIYQDLLKGVIVIIAVALDMYVKNKGNGLSRNIWNRARRSAVNS
ncbi:MAG: ABC transporter permease [Eubacteriales bacterium]|nr:ABC transporter permease [Eubacteriales bacterium]